MKFYPFLFLFGLLYWQLNFAKTISIQGKNLPLASVITELASELKVNILLSPSLPKQTDLNLLNVEMSNAFNLILKINGLRRLQRDGVIYIAPFDEIKHLLQTESEVQDTRLTTSTWHLKFARADLIAKQIEKNQAALLSQRGILFFDKQANRIMLRETRDVIKTVDALIKEFDIPIQQIQINARLVNVDLDCESALGIEYGNAQSLHGDEKQANSSTKSTFINFKIGRFIDSAVLDVRLAALESTGKAELVSAPRLFTSNLETATIEAGEEVPYQEVSEGGGTGVTFKKAVLSLQVTPQILPNNKVLLNLRINQDRPSSKLIQGVPLISTRQIQTSILVSDGQTVTLGGIYEEGEGRSIKGVSFLSNLPLLGWLFKHQIYKKNKRELLIFVTPKVINEKHEKFTQ